MIKAFKYLKPFWLSVVAIIGLVFAQAQCELALPDYMSNIVTYGIQYSGITETIPEAMSKETYEHLAYFMSEDDYAVVEKSYSLSNTCTITKKNIYNRQ